MRKVQGVWTHFEHNFVQLWTDEEVHAGESYKRAVYPDIKDVEKAQTRYMNRLWKVRTEGPRVPR